MSAGSTDAVIMRDLVIYLRPSVNSKVHFLVADRADLLCGQLFIGGTAATISPAIEAPGVEPWSSRSYRPL